MDAVSIVIARQKHIGRQHQRASFLLFRLRSSIIDGARTLILCIVRAMVMSWQMPFRPLSKGARPAS